MKRALVIAVEGQKGTQLTLRDLSLQGVFACRECSLAVSVIYAVGVYFRLLCLFMCFVLAGQVGRVRRMPLLGAPIGRKMPRVSGRT